MSLKKLDAKESRFVDEYLIDLNPRRAAIEAGYSETTASSKAYQWVSNSKIKPHVYDEIRIRFKRRETRTEISQDRVLQELAKIGFSDLRNVLSAGGAIIEPTEWDDDTAGAISSLEVVTRHDGETDEEGRRIPEHVHKIKAWDKLSALEKLGKHLGMFDGIGSEDKETPSLNIHITADAPVSDVRITRSEG